MASFPQLQSVQHGSETCPWTVGARIAFRFCFIYFGLFCATTQILGGLFPIPNVEFPDVASLWPIRQIVFWTAAHVFQVKSALVYTGSGSGDKTFDWVLVFCLLTAAVLAVAVWSAIDGKRDNYIALDKWFRLFIRFALASEMILYGMDKVIPLQMPYPFLTRLVEPFGNFSPMGVLWSSIGAAPPYEVFAGNAEMLGGLLLVFRRTTTLGALICLADMIQVFALNMTYDVPVKLFSFHLLLLSIFLLAPDLQRLANFFLLNRVSEPPKRSHLFTSRRANLVVLAVQIVFGVWLVAGNSYAAWRSWYAFGGGRSKSPLYGIWNVDQLSIDGAIHPSLLTDSDRWRRAIFDFPNRMTFQRMDDSFTNYGASINAEGNTLALTKSDDKTWRAALAFRREDNDRLTLDGDFGGHKIHMQLVLVDRNRFLLVNRGFHWIQEYPFNR